MNQSRFTPLSFHDIATIHSFRQLLRDGPTSRGVFTGEGELWAVLKQGEPIKSYTQPLSRQVTNKISEIIDKLGI